jgi:formamidopyrimidine-DNA glycosylase
MPELPEVETVRRGLEPAMAGQRLIAVEQRRKDLRFPFPARFKERLEGQRVTGLSRRAKYLVLHLSSEEALIMHLGMSGRFTVEMGDKTSKPGDFHYETTGTSPHDHIVFHMENGARITYNDPRRFGFMDLVPSASLSESKHFKAMGI